MFTFQLSSSRALKFVFISALGISGFANAAANQSDGELQMVIVLTRHGVRSPTATPDALDMYSSKPWPTWSVAPGYLTPHGKQLMTIMGGWYRVQYASEGLLPPNGCLSSDSTVVIADDEERTLESARGLIAGFDSQCTLSIRSAPKRGPEALFSHDFSNATSEQRSAAAAAILGRIGNDPSRLAASNRALLVDMQNTLLGCIPGTCSASETNHKKILMDQPASVSPDNDGLVGVKSPLHNASTFAENFFLEYVEGMPMSDVAWGRISPEKVGQFLSLHSTFSDISLRTSTVAKAYAGPLALHIAATFEQKATTRPVNGALVNPNTNFLFLVGHDTNIETLGGLLAMHWLLPEQPADPTFTGGALVFELRRVSGKSQYTVRAYYVSQSLEQMRDSKPLDLAHPPEKAPIFIPGCSQSTPGFNCPLGTFVRLVDTAASTHDN